MDNKAIRTAERSLGGNLRPHLDLLRLKLVERAEVVVYTAIFGPIDGLQQPLVANRRTRFVCFTDQEVPADQAGAWEIRPAIQSFPSKRLTSRWHKLNAHLALPEADYSLYLDGTFRLNLDPAQALVWFLGRNSLAMMKHPDRDCLYDEIQACIRYRKDDARILEDQAEAYRAQSFPARQGLTATGVILRRHDESSRRINEAWWREVQARSMRDQCSLFYVLHQLGLGLDIIPGNIWTNPCFPYTPHVQGMPPERP